MGDWTGFLVDFWEGRMDAHEEVDTPTMRRITEALRSHYDEYGAWPEKIRATHKVVAELRKETRKMNTIPGFRYWPTAGMKGVTLFDVRVEWVDLQKPAKPKGVLDLS